jgi:hypothetical protein
MEMFIRSIETLVRGVLTTTYMLKTRSHVGLFGANSTDGTGLSQDTRHFRLGTILMPPHKSTLTRGVLPEAIRTTQINPVTEQPGWTCAKAVFPTPIVEIAVARRSDILLLSLPQTMLSAGGRPPKLRMTRKFILDLPAIPIFSARRSHDTRIVHCRMYGPPQILKDTIREALNRPPPLNYPLAESPYRNSAAHSTEAPF